MKLSACLISLDSEEWIDLTLQSIIDVVDEIIIVDGGSTDRTLEIIDSFDNNKIKVFHRKWNDDWGDQRQFALDNATGDWILQIDTDEILDDSGFQLRDLAESDTTDCYNLQYIHFIRDFGHIDTTVPTHIGLHRFFKKLLSVKYPNGMHELAMSNEWREAKDVPIKIWHLGYTRSIKTIMDKIKQQRLYSKMHPPAYLDEWFKCHIFGEDSPSILTVGKFADFEGFPWVLKKYLGMR